MTHYDMDEKAEVMGQSTGGVWYRKTIPIAWLCPRDRQCIGLQMLGDDGLPDRIEMHEAAQCSRCSTQYPLSDLRDGLCPVCCMQLDLGGVEKDPPLPPLERHRPSERLPADRQRIVTPDGVGFYAASTPYAASKQWFIDNGWRSEAPAWWAYLPEGDE